MRLEAEQCNLHCLSVTQHSTGQAQSTGALCGVINSKVKIENRTKELRN